MVILGMKTPRGLVGRREHDDVVPTYPSAFQTILDREPVPPEGVRTAEIDYDADGTPCRGFLAAPAGATSAPGVLVVHDWSGVGDYVQMRCEMLARLGYVAFAADVYGASVRPAPDQAPSVAGSFYRDPSLFRSRLTAAYHRLLSEDTVDRARTAAIGYCFGGAGVLQLARTGADLAGVVTFHGSLQTGPPGEAAGIRARVLVLTGAVDPVVPDDAVLALQNEFRAVPSLDWQVVTYASAMHAFTQPSADAPDHGAQFNARAEARSWIAMKNFLTEIFG
jgi:dienelactone hydrolase